MVMVLSEVEVGNERGREKGKLLQTQVISDVLVELSRVSLP